MKTKLSDDLARIPIADCTPFRLADLSRKALMLEGEITGLHLKIKELTYKLKQGDSSYEHESTKHAIQ